MPTHIISMTYGPKVDDVFSGKCKRTMRLSRKFEKGDTLLIHEWVGRPYRSKWGRRLRTVVKKVVPVILNNEAITMIFIDEDAIMSFPWDGGIAANMAALDGIKAPKGDDRPLGLIWRDVIMNLNEDSRLGDMDFKNGVEGAIISWEDD